MKRLVTLIVSLSRAGNKVAMGKIDRPSFSLHKAAEIEQAQNDVESCYWDALRNLLIYPPDDTSRQHSYPSPKTPEKLRLTLASYAGELLNAEARSYPDDPRLKLWLKNLKGRIIHRVADTVELLERQGESRGVSLTYHGATAEQLRASVDEELDRRIKKRLFPPETRVAPAPPIEIGHRTGFQGLTGREVELRKRAGIDLDQPSPLLEMVRAVHEETGLSLPSPSDERQDERQLLVNAYRARFPIAKIRDICWAANQHYREWKRWKKYESKDGSTPDRAFRTVLTSGKPPAKIRPESRPKGWE